MKYAVTNTITEYIDIELPCFKKYGSHRIKFIDEQHSIEVVDSDWDLSFSIRVYTAKHTSFDTIMQKGTPISEQEFEQALQDVSEKIGNAIKQSLQTA